MLHCAEAAGYVVSKVCARTIAAEKDGENLPIIFSGVNKTWIENVLRDKQCQR